MRKPLYVAVLGLLTWQLAAVNSMAQPAATKPAVKFTRVQDLNPNAVSKNQPIKQKWAVVVGISKFQDRRLSNDMGNDRAARAFYSYLTDQKSGRFAPDHVKLLTNESATQRSMISALGDRWLGSLAGKDDLVVVFIATSGFPTTDGGTYLSAYDCALDNVYGTCLSIKDLMQTLRQSVKAERVVLVLQSAYSGSADLTSGAKALGSSSRNFNIDLTKLPTGKGYVILSSSQPDQLTWGDAFSQNLIAALKEQDGLVPLQTAFRKAKEQTEYDTTHRQYPPKTQSPTMKSEWTGQDLILGVPPLEKVSNVPADVSTFLGAEAHYLRASQAAGAGNIEEALNQYKLALAADPDYADAIADYGVALGLQGKWQEALTQLNKAVQLAPSDVLYRTNLARAYDKTGNTGECIKQLEFAYSLNPRDSMVIKALAGKAAAAGDLDTARRLMKELQTLYPAASETKN